MGLDSVWTVSNARRFQRQVNEEVHETRVAPLQVWRNLQKWTDMLFFGPVRRIDGEYQELSRKFHVELPMKAAASASN